MKTFLILSIFIIWMNIESFDCYSTLNPIKRYSHVTRNENEHFFKKTTNFRSYIKPRPRRVSVSNQNYQITNSAKNYQFTNDYKKYNNYEPTRKHNNHVFSTNNYRISNSNFKDSTKNNHFNPRAYHPSSPDQVYNDGFDNGNNYYDNANGYGQNYENYRGHQQKKGGLGFGVFVFFALVLIAGCCICCCFIFYKKSDKLKEGFSKIATRKGESAQAPKFPVETHSDTEIEHEKEEEQNTNDDKKKDFPQYPPASH
jgi:hypothetical protein